MIKESDKVILLDKVLALVGSPRGYLSSTDDVLGLVRRDTAMLVSENNRAVLALGGEDYLYMSDVLDITNGLLTSKGYTLIRFLFDTQYDPTKARSFSNALINNIPDTFTVDKEMSGRLLRPSKIINKLRIQEKDIVL